MVMVAGLITPALLPGHTIVTTSALVLLSLVPIILSGSGDDYPINRPVTAYAGIMCSMSTVSCGVKH